MGGAAAIPYSYAPSQALCGTVAETGEDFTVQSKVLQLMQEIFSCEQTISSL